MSKRKINMSDIFNEVNDEKATVLPKQETIYNIDYAEFELTQDEEQTLIKCEHDISHHLKNIGQHMLWYYDALYQANEIFAKHKTGCWGKWLNKMGIKKDKANIAIRKYKLYLQGKYIGKENQQVLELPDRAVKKITNADTVFVESDITEIISSENPKEKFKDIESQKSIKNNDTKEFLQKELKRKEKQLNKIKEEIKNIKEKLQKISCRS